MRIIFHSSKIWPYSTKKRIVENGVETVTTEEDGVLKSKTVNGVSQAIEYRKK